MNVPTYSKTRVTVTAHRPYVVQIPEDLSTESVFISAPSTTDTSDARPTLADVFSEYLARYRRRSFGVFRFGFAPIFRSRTVLYFILFGCVLLSLQRILHFALFTVPFAIT
jgi:hypothetical protein